VRKSLDGTWSGMFISGDSPHLTIRFCKVESA